MGVWAGGHNPVLTTLCQYDAEGNLSQMTYPEGRVVAYSPQASGPARIAAVNAMLNGSSQPIVSAITYYPFGDTKTMSFGNGIQFNNHLDKRYFPQRITAAGVMDLEYSVDNRGNIIAITDNIHSSRSQQFAYDLKDQLTSATGAYGVFNWSYDPLGNRTFQQHLSGTNMQTTYSYGSLASPVNNRLVHHQTIDPPTATSYDANTVTVIYPERVPRGKSLQQEWDEMIAEGYAVLDAADAGRTSRSYNNLVGKFNAFINHSQWDRKFISSVFSHNNNLSRLINLFLDRREWNGPREENGKIYNPRQTDPWTWTPHLRGLAREILGVAAQISFIETEAGTQSLVIQTDYAYDAVGSLTTDHTYTAAGLPGDTTRYDNNEDSRLKRVLGTNAAIGAYFYDHLGQRVIKEELGMTIFIYDIFGNLIAEHNSDLSLIADYVYLGGTRLAKIEGGEGGGWGGFPGCNWRRF